MDLKKNARRGLKRGLYRGSLTWKQDFFKLKVVLKESLFRGFIHMEIRGLKKKQRKKVGLKEGCSGFNFTWKSEGLKKKKLS